MKLGAVNSHHYEEKTCPLGVDVFANSPKISDITKSNFFQRNFRQSDQKHDGSAVAQISTVFGLI